MHINIKKTNFIMYIEYNYNVNENIRVILKSNFIFLYRSYLILLALLSKRFKKMILGCINVLFLMNGNKYNLLLNCNWEVSLAIFNFRKLLKKTFIFISIWY